MKTENFVVDAQLRNDEGKGASRRLRRTGMVPAVIYGGSTAPQSISLALNVMLQHIEHEAFFSHILDINVAGKSEKAVVKDIQMHPFKPVIMHMDFQRVDENSVIRMHVPIHFIGEDVAPGIKSGSVFTHQLTSVDVSCPANKLPEFIELDVSGMKMGDSLHLSDIKLPAGVEIVELSHGPEHDLPVVTIVATRGGVSEEEEVVAE
jgi:large subunit ribosomal protein L25